MSFLLKKQPRIPSELSYEAPSHALASGFGIAPSGSLNVELSQKWIELHYRVPADVQQFYHPKPGVNHSKIYRIAYIPRTRDGQRLLVRYQYAFLHGHSFSVGYSTALKRDNQVTWSSWMPHKTATTGGGPFGYPDDKYIEKAHQAMDRLSVPRDVQTCQRWCLQHLRRKQDQNMPVTLTSVDPRFQLRQEIIQFVAPQCWYQSTQFSKYFKVVQTEDVCKAQSSNTIPTIRSPLSVVASAPLAADLASICPIPPPTVSMQHCLPVERTSDDLKFKSTLSRFGVSLRPAAILTVEDLCKNVDSDTTSSECPICNKALQSNSSATLDSQDHAIRIKVCKHLCHEKCLLELLRKDRYKCPQCMEPTGMLCFGGQPSGSMTVRLDMSQSCPGFSDRDGVICIQYEIPPGIQADYMECPGQRYEGTNQAAYLPNNEAGRRLLVRLRHAFCNGLTFLIGRSCIIGLSNQVTWTSIPHKTSLNGGVHGFPDPHFIRKCGDFLDAFGVPVAESCV